MEPDHLLVELKELERAASNCVERVYTTLESLCICFPARLAGTENLEHSLDFLLEYGKDHVPHDLCWAEEVSGVPHWVRGDWRQEVCEVTIIPSATAKPTPFPLTRSIRVLANGLSIGTGKDGVHGPLKIIHSWEELQQAGTRGELQGCIVLYDYKHFVTYGDHNSFRAKGANAAATFGAIGVLIRTLAPDTTFSGPHTGVQQEYHVDRNGAQIAVPAGCIAVEDAELLSRLAQRGHTFSATLCLPCTMLPERTSRNLVFEIRGTELPDEVVVVGGHTDCWDCQHGCCQGAHDDGQGVVIALEIVCLLHRLGMRPRRTVRAVLFVDEEVRQSGAIAYAKAHGGEESRRMVAAIETDLGVGPVCGFGFTGTPEGRTLLRELLRPLESLLGAVTEVDERWSGKGVDISPLIEEHGVPGLLLRHSDTWWNGEYFHIHHSASDTIDHVDKDLLKLNFQVLLCTVWILANAEKALNAV
jgi:carboxypeptidase Q